VSRLVERLLARQALLGPHGVRAGEHDVEKRVHRAVRAERDGDSGFAQRAQRHEAVIGAEARTHHVHDSEVSRVLDHNAKASGAPGQLVHHAVAVLIPYAPADYDVAPDGRFVFIEDPPESPVSQRQIVLIPDFASELREMLRAASR
jgi:hypothetical protein